MGSSRMSGKDEKRLQAVEVAPDRPRRRHFTLDFKLRVLDLARKCTESGEIGALLRREGIYSSHLAEWRRARRQGELSALAPRKRGPSPHRDSRDERIAALEAEVNGWKRRAERAEGLVEVQKKVA